MRIALSLLGMLVCGVLSLPVAAAEFPNRTVRILVGFAPGGTTDLLARILADELRSIWKVPVIVENRPGADGVVAATGMHNDPDGGHTLLLGTNALLSSAHLRQLPFDPLKDLEPITIVGQEFHHMLVPPALPAATVKDFVQLAKTKPGGLTFASAGLGSAGFIGTQRFIKAAGIRDKMIHVPFPGGTPAVLAVVQGNVDSLFVTPSTTLPLSREGKVRILAVAGPNRDPNAPEAPTFAESGFPGFESSGWFGLLVSSKVDSQALAIIRRDVAQAMRNPTVLRRIDEVRSVPIGNSSEQFRQIMKADFEVYGQILASSK